jgi:acyl-homoserine-lactone acylase
MRTSLFRRWAVAAVAVGLIASGCSGDDGDDSSPSTTAAPGEVKGDGDRYEATIRRDAAGVAHITGATLADATFGQGWASGEDRACDLADQIIEVTSQRARWFGPGDDDANIRSDVSWKAIGVVDVAKADWETAEDDVRALMTAYADGWNAQLEAVGADGIDDWCAGEPWVQPVEALDIYTYARSIALLASSGAVSSMLATAAPPETTAAPADPDEADGPDDTTGTTATPAALRGAFEGLNEPALASNGWAIGADRATAGGGMLVGNPHFPWEGELRFWEVHLTVPGEVDIYGVQLSGLPGVGIGFTEDFGWTHTVSAGNRFTAYRLDLVDGDPTRYVYGDTTKEIESSEVTIEVLGDDGELTEETRTIWRSHYGPMLDFPGVGWSDSMAITMRDANIDNDEFIVQYLQMTTAKDLDELIEINREVSGVPLFNTIATSSDGRAWYADTSATPALSDEAIATLEELLESDPLVKAAADSGAILLDGSDPVFEWEERPGARDPGLVPFDDMPSTTRDDYVFNANDSYWLSNAQNRLTGDYSPLHGRRDVAQSFRTRENARVLDDTTPTGPSGDDGTFTLDELADAAVLNRGFTAAELLDDVVARCQAAGSSPVEVAAVTSEEGDEVIPAGSVELADACAVLADWDGIYDLDRSGPVLWRETLRALGSSLEADGEIWATPFDPADPVATPGGLAAAPADGPDPVLVALGRAVKVLEVAELEVDVELGEVQKARRGDDLVPIHGGDGIDGVPNVVSFARNWTTLDPTLTDLEREVLVPEQGLAEVTDADGRTTTGYRINYGTSFLFALAYGPDGPQAKAFLTYGNTADRSSKAYTEATEAFSEKAWRDVAFTEADVAAATTSTATVRG